MDARRGEDVQAFDHWLRRSLRQRFGQLEPTPQAFLALLQPEGAGSEEPKQG